jgi:hypothetical protein
MSSRLHWIATRKLAPTALNLMEYSMRSTFLVLTVTTTLFLASSVAADARSMAVTAVPNGAPIGHLQPRAQQFAPGSTVEQTEQQDMSKLDAQQHKLDEELDRHLNICRGC